MTHRYLTLLNFLEACEDVLYARTQPDFDTATMKVRCQQLLVCQGGDLELAEASFLLERLLPRKPIGGPDACEEERRIAALMNVAIMYETDQTDDEVNHV